MRVTQNRKEKMKAKFADGKKANEAGARVRLPPMVDVLQKKDGCNLSIQKVAQKIKFSDSKDLFKRLYASYFSELADLALPSAVEFALKLLKKKINYANELFKDEWKDLTEKERKAMFKRYITQLHAHLAQRLELVKQNMKKKIFKSESGKVEIEDIRYWFSDFEFWPYDGS